MRIKRIYLVSLLVAALAGLAIGQASAYVELVTVPRREAVEMTIYRAVDLTLVREYRYLTFKAGLNLIEFSWRDTKIDPTSIKFTPLEHPEIVRVIDLVYPPDIPMALLWTIEADAPILELTEVSYFTAGVRWESEYTMIAEEGESTFTLFGNVRIINNSGEDYDETAVRLVVGEVNLVHGILALAEEFEKRRGAPPQLALDWGVREEMAEVPAPVPARILRRAPEIVTYGVGDYYLYAIEGAQTIPHTWHRTLPRIEVERIPLKVAYRYTGGKVHKYYEFVNDSEHNLGLEPLPAGSIQIFRRSRNTSLTYLGSSSIVYTARGGKVTLDLGREVDILAGQELLDYKKTDVQFDEYNRVTFYREHRTYRYWVQNFKKERVTVSIGGRDIEVPAGERREFTTDSFRDVHPSLPPLR